MNKILSMTKKQRNSIPEKKQKSLIDIKNKQPQRAETQLALNKDIVPILFPMIY